MIGQREQGFVYAAVLVALVVMGIALAALGDAWNGIARRERERELLFAGHQFRDALMQYYRHSPPGAPRHPYQLADLLRDPRVPAMRRYLRKIYTDPITGSAEWGLARGADGAIYGVYSLSQERPLKHGRFARTDQNFVAAATYAEWVFMFSPGQAAAPSLPP
ncbi:type II secretion system protein [Massilia horti]|uniref:Type II secretion system protein n=1 Tax=Massilia horti TaxID=2562153 RepID=A0A4Y9SZT9_9BURK|nr:type II secretion system protein [Massilia horti]TFW32301.1 type II secretion system protein [Massilia horti]